MIYYSEDNIANHYLSPYVQISIENDRIVFYNRLYHSISVLNKKDGNLNKILLDQLRYGIDQNSLLDLLRKDCESDENAVLLYEDLMRKGIIE